MSAGEVDHTNPRLLATKLHLPRRREGTVARRRLVDRLAGAEDVPLTLVSAPAGFGKTTVVVDWLADHTAVAWVSLDRRDDDPARFWSYLAAAVTGVLGDVGLDEVPPGELLGALLNALDSTTGEVVVVLDDYHVIESPAIHDDVAFLVERLPAGVRLVVTSRADPALPLATLRARGQLLELRAADLRFTDDEAQRFLEGSMGLALGRDQVTALGARTEGWIAALQLAGLSVQGREDVDGFIAGFAGDDRFVVDYLVGEVLDRQPDAVRSFLLHTSVLGTLTGPACDAVTGATGSQDLLRQLDRANLLLVALDDRRIAYRYHHLFADVLRARLLDDEPEVVGELHGRACEWHAEQGDLGEAVDHALAGGHADRAAELVELVAPAMRRDRREATLRRWGEALPVEVVEQRPSLAVTLAGARMATGDRTGVEGLLDWAEAALEAAQPLVADPAELATLPAQVEVYRAGLALLSGDTEATTRHARRVLDLLGPDEHLGRGSASALIGLAHWRHGELADAVEWYQRSIDHLAAAGHHADVLGCSLALADLQVAQGRLADAAATFEAGLRTTRAHPGLRGAADMHVGLAEVAIERDELDAAAGHLRAAAELGRPAGLPQHPYRELVAAARLAHARGDTQEALELLDAAAPLYDTDFSPPIRPVRALEARLRLTQGDVAAAERWALATGIEGVGSDDYVRGYELATFARLLLARHGGGDLGAGRTALDLSGQLLAAAEQRGQDTVELLVLLAAAQRTVGDDPSASATRATARERAAREHHLRPLLDAEAVPGRAPRPGSSVLVDELSSRELDVLRLLRSDLSGPEIARELHVSLNTFRTHTKSIYAKLGATTRREAIRRAGELGL